MLQVLDLPSAIASPSAERVLETLQNPVVVVSSTGDIVYANATAAAHFGGWIVGLGLSDIFPGDHGLAGALAGPVAKRLVTEKEMAYDAMLNPLDGSSICVSLWPLIAAPEPARLNEIDDLTGLSKRAVLMASLDRALAAAADHASTVAVHCLDLDRFKSVNDTLGHGIGDQLLKKVADRLRNACRKDDVVARIGGDEFVILQSRISGPEDAGRLASRLVDLVGRTYVLNGHTVNIGVSVGVALSKGPMQARDLLRNGDLALYESKRAGRGRYRFFENEMFALLCKRREIEIDMRRALALKQFELHYQPFFDVSDERVMGFEALLRWQHPVRGTVPPLDFIPIAEENGLIVKVGEWVLMTACKEAASWPNDLTIAVNVSPVQFKADTLLATISSALKQSGLPASRLEIEITEGALLDDTENVLATLHAVRALGVKISMDDFGTGYSSLSYLQRFPFNKIKIDRSFVIGSDADSEAILKAVAGLGSNLGIAITAEGVETAEQLKRVRDQNCTHVQGYLTGRPMNARMVDSFLAQQGQSDVE
jgi:diguanylate cyclase (GGDEF)-like protein